MRCKSCKYFAVPLSEDEKRVAHCPQAANPLGEEARKVCVLEHKQGFDVDVVDPENCSYFFPLFMRFR